MNLLKDVLRLYNLKEIKSLDNFINFSQKYGKCNFYIDGEFNIKNFDNNINSGHNYKVQVISSINNRDRSPYFHVALKGEKDAGIYEDGFTNIEWEFDYNKVEREMNFIQRRIQNTLKKLNKSFNIDSHLKKSEFGIPYTEL